MPEKIPKKEISKVAEEAIRQNHANYTRWQAELMREEGGYNEEIASAYRKIILSHPDWLNFDKEEAKRLIKEELAKKEGDTYH